MAWPVQINGINFIIGCGISNKTFATYTTLTSRVGTWLYVLFRGFHLSVAMIYTFLSLIGSYNTDRLNGSFS